MFNSLQDIIDAAPVNELIDPFDLSEGDVIGSELVPIVTMGIFNPMGPTIVALNLLTKPDSNSAGLLYTSLNPFAQTRLVFARCGNNPISLTQFLPSAHKVGDELLLGCYPDFVLPSTEIDMIVDAVEKLMLELVSRAPSRDDLAETTAKIKKHWKDPWSRIPSVEKTMRDALSGNASDPIARPSSGDDFNEWFSTVTHHEHLSTEIAAIMQGWKGAIEFQGDTMPHMPLEEVIDELATLSHPLFQTLRDQ
jgi:hypothetical protein